jgi:hypothetical protein
MKLDVKILIQWKKFQTHYFKSHIFIYIVLKHANTEQNRDILHLKLCLK